MNTVDTYCASIRLPIITIFADDRRADDDSSETHPGGNLNSSYRAEVDKPGRGTGGPRLHPPGVA